MTNSMLLIKHGFDAYKRERTPAQFLFDVQFRISQGKPWDESRADAYWIVNDIRTEILFGTPLGYRPGISTTTP